MASVRAGLKMGQPGFSLTMGSIKSTIALIRNRTSGGREIRTEVAHQDGAPLILRSGNIVRSVAEFEVAPDSQVWREIRIYDVIGRRRTTIPLAGNRYGSELVRWSPLDSRGAQLAKGIYFARLWNGRTESQATRLILLESGSKR